MNKIILTLSFLLIANYSFAANDYTITELNCMAVNGVNLSTVGADGDGVIVESSWGRLKKNFVVNSWMLGFGVPSVLLLKPESGGRDYLLVLDFNPDISGVQTAHGSLKMTAKILEFPTIFISTVTCTVQIKEK